MELGTPPNPTKSARPYSGGARRLVHHLESAFDLAVPFLGLDDGFGGQRGRKFFPDRRLGQRGIQIHRFLDRKFARRPLNRFARHPATVEHSRRADNQTPSQPTREIAAEWNRRRFTAQGRRSPLPKIHAQRHAERASRAEQAQQHIEAAAHVQGLNDAGQSGDHAAEDGEQHHRVGAFLVRGHFAGEVEGDDFVGHPGAIHAADGTGNPAGHPPADGFNVERVTLTATALDFNRYHNSSGLRVTPITYASRVPSEIPTKRQPFLL